MLARINSVHRHHRVIQSLGLFTLLLAAALILLITTPVLANPEKIVFASDRDGNYEIYVMDADGSYQTRLTHNSAGDFVPKWSPDGTKITFASNRDGNWEVYVMNSDGSDQRNLTNHPTLTDLDPSWSPDGTKIVFLMGGVTLPTTMAVMDLDGTILHDVSFGCDEVRFPDWSPDGTKIAYFRQPWPNCMPPLGNAGVFVMNATPFGTNEIRLTSNYNNHPRWSRDGTTIAYWSFSSNGGDVYLMDRYGLNPTHLTNPASDRSLTWSPDGSKIGFSRPVVTGNSEIYRMDSNGANLTNLTNHVSDDRDPDWRSGVSHTMLKICKVAGPGITVGTQFTFNFSIVGQPSLAIAQMTIPAGPESIGGYCYFVTGPYAQGTFIPGQSVTITETPASPILVADIRSSTASNLTTDFPARTATTTLGAVPYNDIYFTNGAIRTLQICKVAGRGIAPRTKFTFDVTIPSEPGLSIKPVSVMAGECVFVQGPYIAIGGIGTFLLDQVVDVSERASDGVRVTDISSSTGTLLSTDLRARTASIQLASSGDWEPNVLTFTNAR